MLPKKCNCFRSPDYMWYFLVFLDKQKMDIEYYISPPFLAMNALVYCQNYTVLVQSYRVQRYGCINHSIDKV